MKLIKVKITTTLKCKSKSIILKTRKKVKAKKKTKGSQSPNQVIYHNKKLMICWTKCRIDWEKDQVWNAEYLSHLTGKVRKNYQLRNLRKLSQIKFKRNKKLQNRIQALRKDFLERTQLIYKSCLRLGYQWVQWESS